MPTPFEEDSARKAKLSYELHDSRARRRTCVCGVVRQYHRAEIETGRCKGFRSMSLKQWAEWIGVEYRETE